MPHPCIIPWNETRKREHAKGFMMPFVNEEACGAHQLAVHLSVIKPGERAHEPHAHRLRSLFTLFIDDLNACVHTSAPPCRFERSHEVFNALPVTGFFATELFVQHPN